MSIQDDSMKLIPKGEYTVGIDKDMGYPVDLESKSLKVKTDGFYIDTTAVSNASFAEFVEDTGYITDAEKLNTSFVFYKLLEVDSLGNQLEDLNWWLDVVGASWKHPYGDKRSYKDALNHPVVHITVHDAMMYCKWAGKRLPTEIEWEIAAKGDSIATVYPWGDDLYDGVHRANVWQGDFPHENSLDDGYLGTAPVDAFYENSYGIKQMIGNVWELCSNASKINIKDIVSTDIDTQLKTYQSASIHEYAAKGGSFLCHHSYCNRYRLAARNGVDRLTASSNVGFRCVKDI